MKGPVSAWVRRLTAWLMLAGTIAVVALAVRRAREIKMQIAEVGSAGEVPAAEGRDEGETVGVYHGFKYVETVAGQLAFALSSSRTLGLSSGWHEIKNVQLDLYRQGEISGVLTCDGASFNVQTRDARLGGRVQLRLPDGSLITTDKGRFEASTRELVTEAETVYMSPQAIGRTARARYSVTEDRLLLEGGVVIHSVEGMSLTAPRLAYQRDRGLVEAPEGCRLRFREGSLEAPSALVELDPGGGMPRRLELEGGVTMTGVEGPATLDGWTERLSAQRDPAGSWQFRATTSGPWVTLVSREDGAYYERRLTTWRLRGVVAPSGILTTVAEDGVCLYEVPVEDPPRRTESGSAQVWFDAGRVSELELEEKVLVVSEGLRATGARARVASQPGLVMLHASPAGGQRASLSSGQGRVTADQVQIRHRERSADARGNVQGSIDDAALLGGPGSADAPSPVHFAADRLTVLDEGDAFLLEGSARAWQGRRLLQGDSITYRQRDQSLSATGHVRTTIPGQEVQTGETAPGEAVVEARSLDYAAAEKKAVYRGGVRYRDGLRRLQAAELVVVLDDDSRAESLEALGGVEIEDLATGRRMRGQRARREASTRTVTLVGSPVQLSDERGNTVSGSSLTWEEASGRVTISGGPEAPTETIFYPSSEPGALPGGLRGSGTAAPTPGPLEEP